MKTNQFPVGTMGSASLICGFLGLFVLPFLLSQLGNIITIPFILGLFLLLLMLSVLGIIFGIIGLNKHQKYSIAGLIMGILGFVFGLILLISFLMG